MKTSRIFASLCALLLISFFSLQSVSAQRDTTAVKGIQFVRKALTSDQQKGWHLNGVAVSGNLLGVFLANFTSYGEYEAALRLDFSERFFPIVEAGWGVCNKDNEETQLHYEAYAPYARIGLDYNFNKDRMSGNRIFGGFRVGFSSFKYDVSAQGVADPVWKTAMPFDYKGVSSNMLWMELVFGLEAKIWKGFRLGWSARYRRRLHQKENEPGAAWYVPGFGHNDTHTFGGTFNLVFDIGKTSK